MTSFMKRLLSDYIWYAFQWSLYFTLSEKPLWSSIWLMHVITILMSSSFHFRVKLRPFVNAFNSVSLMWVVSFFFFSANLHLMSWNSIPPKRHLLLCYLLHMSWSSFPLLAHTTFLSCGHLISSLLQYLLSCWLFLVIPTYSLCSPHHVIACDS